MMLSMASRLASMAVAMQAYVGLVQWQQRLALAVKNVLPETWSTKQTKAASYPGDIEADLAAGQSVAVWEEA